MESGLLTSAIGITNTHQVGVVRDALVADASQKGDAGWHLPVVAETYDGWLNDIDAFHVKGEHTHRALDSAEDGPVSEGNVGDGTGMVCHEVNLKRVRQLMRLMGVEAVYQKPRLSPKNPQHKVYPCLLREVTVERPDQAWSTDINHLRADAPGLGVPGRDPGLVQPLRPGVGGLGDAGQRLLPQYLERALALETPEIFNNDQGRLGRPPEPWRPPACKLA